MEIAEEIRITDLETLKVISAPLRVQILERIGLASDSGQLTTVKQLSEDLDIPPTKLYYHINLLEKHGLIRIADTKVVSGIIEKYFQISAKRIRADFDISKNATLDRDEGMALTLSSLKTLLNKAYKYVEKSLQHRMQEDSADQQETATMLSSQAMLQLSPDQAENFISDLKELIGEYVEINNPDGLAFGLTIVFNPNYHIKFPKREPQSLMLGNFQDPLNTRENTGVRIPPQL